MSLPDDYLQYPWRRHGHDHPWFEWRLLRSAHPVQWPEGRALAVWLHVSLQHFPLDQKGVPFKVPNGMTMPYPDLRHYSLRDYGNRVGVFRVMEALAAQGMPATWAVNAELAERRPWLVRRVASTPGAELVAHGWNMDTLLHNGMGRDQERQWIARSREALQQTTGMPVRGWLSPARQQSWHTLELLAEFGFEYCQDWVNDDMPYPVLPGQGRLHMMPLNAEIEDQFVMGQQLHAEDAWAQQVEDAIDCLLEEATALGQGRMLGISLHPWLVGQPHRIACLERVLGHLAALPGVWVATASDILSHWIHQQPEAA
jgi:allantoinase